MSKLFKIKYSLFAVAILVTSSVAYAQERDPFSPAGGVVKVIKEEVAGESLFPNQALNPKIAYKITSYKVVGTLISKQKQLAAIKALNGMDYIVLVGEKIGSEGGKITKIEQDGIIIKNSEGEIKLPVSNKIEVNLDKVKK